LSNVGSLALLPKYRSSKLSKLAAALDAEEAALVALEEASEAFVVAIEA